MQTHWRLAFMFDAPAGDFVVLEEGLRQARGRIAAAADGNGTRIGIAFRDDVPDSAQDSHDSSGWRTVDGAVEITLANGSERAIPGICRAMRPILARIARPDSLEVMAGAMHHMVPVRSGGAFLSLAFRRDQGTPVAQFRDWWLNRHSKVAIPVLGEGMLAYDQVHVDSAATRAAADALGVPFADYDAYDNLTFRDRQGFIDSVSDAEGMAKIAEDEVGRIDNSTRRHALMRELV